jgi:hypothetical protein
MKSMRRRCQINAKPTWSECRSLQEFLDLGLDPSRDAFCAGGYEAHSPKYAKRPFRKMMSLRQTHPRTYIFLKELGKVRKFAVRVKTELPQICQGRTLEKFRALARRLHSFLDF